MHNVLTLILGGGKGTRLYPLTQFRSKPAVPIAGKYRLIDIPISNCINSGFNRVYVLTQFLSVSLHRHISNTYKFDPFSQGFVEVLAAQQTNEAADWYQGTADAVRQNIRYIEEDPGREILILSGDQLYRMDFRDLLRTHRDSRADVTIAVLPVNREQVSGFGIAQIDDKARIQGFVEKPKTDSQLEPVRMPDEWLAAHGIIAHGRNYLANMGIYLFSREALLGMLQSQTAAVDFGKDIFPRNLKNYHVHAHLFEGYWEDLGTIDSYHEANLALASPNPPFDFHTPEGVIYTRMRNLPASRICGATLNESLVSDGCVVECGTRVERCVLGVRSRIGSNVTLRDTVVMGADLFETDTERASNQARGLPNIGIGDGTVIEGAIVDKDCRIGRNVRIHKHCNSPDLEAEGYVIRDGVVVIPKATVIRDNTVI